MINWTEVSVKVQQRAGQELNIGIRFPGILNDEELTKLQTFAQLCTDLGFIRNIDGETPFVGVPYPGNTATVAAGFSEFVPGLHIPRPEQGGIAIDFALLTQRAERMSFTDDLRRLFEPSFSNFAAYESLPATAAESTRRDLLKKTFEGAVETLGSIIWDLQYPLMAFPYMVVNAYLDRPLPIGARVSGSPNESAAILRWDSNTGLHGGASGYGGVDRHSVNQDEMFQGGDLSTLADATRLFAKDALEAILGRANLSGKVYGHDDLCTQTAFAPEGVEAIRGKLALCEKLLAGYS